MTPEHAERVSRMRDEVAHAFLDHQLEDLKNEVIAERGGHPLQPEQIRQLAPHEQIYRAGVALEAVRAQSQYTKAA